MASGSDKGNNHEDEEKKFPCKEPGGSERRSTSEWKIEPEVEYDAG